jgi:AbrB family looped-hinge helix DNA binding protein
MDAAVLSPKGRITIPADIRRRLGLRGGDKVVFAEQGEDIIIRGPERSNTTAMKELQEAMNGAAEKAGFTCEHDVIDCCKEIRREMWNERYENID